MEKAHVLLLASYHMNNPRRDMYNAEVDDVRSERRQRELEDMATALSRFAPTMVAVEAEPSRQDDLDRDFRAYVQGDLALTPDERQQVGFRIAVHAGLSGVRAIDWNEEGWYGGWDLADAYAWARVHAPDAYRELTSASESFVEEFASRQSVSTVTELHAWINRPATLARLHTTYMTTACLGDLPHPSGTEWVAGWYHRNLRIYFNLVRSLRPGERVLVVYGAGHMQLLGQFARYDRRFEVEDVLSYLTA